MYKNQPQYKQGQQPGSSPDIYRPNKIIPGAGPIASSSHQKYNEEEKKQQP